jgi:sulfate adenylyltransferase (ADP) / ATP adenylyltransferase
VVTHQKGALWQNIVRTTEKALQTGALVPVPTDLTFIEDSGVHFFIRVLASLTRKDKARKQQEDAAKTGKNPNPFCPPEKDLVVADILDTHRAILNKYNVVEHHLLIITRQYEDQDTLLTLKDFEALWLCMAEYKSLGFYNGGKDAGASQQHKHLQLVPLPLAPQGPAIPIEPLISEVDNDGSYTKIPGFPFLHSFKTLRRELMNAPHDAARETFHIYVSMLEQVGMTGPAKNSLTRQSMPYCLLVTRDWMLLIPRSRECFGDISLNSLAFAGSLFVRNKQQLEQIKSFRPMNVLRSVTFPSFI